MLKLIRTSTIPASLENLLKGQLKMLSKYYNVLAVSSPGDDMETSGASVIIKRNLLNSIKII